MAIAGSTSSPSLLSSGTSGGSSVEESGFVFRRCLRGEVWQRLGSVTQFAGDAASVYPRFQDAVGRALKVGKPGTKEFRIALHSELEKAHELAVPNGVVNTSTTDHVGLESQSVTCAWTTCPRQRFAP